MRVQSDRPKLFKTGETGYLHRLGKKITIASPRPQPTVPTIDVHKLLTSWSANPQRQLPGLAAALKGVSSDALGSLGVVYSNDYRAWAFPMRNGHGGLVGIRLRDDNGRKWAVRGSHQGLFLPQSLRTDLCLVCEGPTDTAAALTLGYGSIGRPSCSGGVSDIAMLVQIRHIRRVVIVADNDTPGLEGAKRLAEYLPVPSCTVVLPAKDVREFVQLGGNRATLDSLINASVWTRK